MNIIELAKQAGLYVGTNLSGVQLVGSSYDNGLLVHMDIDDLTRFAALVRNAALEEAKAACKTVGEKPSSFWEEAGCWIHATEICAASVEELKEKT